MVHLTVDIGGKPGVNCRGFCAYCYFKHAKDVPPFGCRYCLPFKKGCDYCSRGVKEGYEGFLPLKEVADNFLADLQSVTDDVTRITISGGGDPSCYPEFNDLMEILGSLDVPLHIGYTSGKGFDSPDVADFLIDNHLTEISFTVFASDPELRREYMHDPTPEASLAVLERLASKIDVYAAIVILPGVNDGAVLEETLVWLEKVGVRGVILMRFANGFNQGLILDNAPLLEGQRMHTPEEFRSLVETAAKNHPNLRLSGTPLYDPLFNSPFAIRNHPELLEKLPRVSGPVSVITGAVAAPYLTEILAACGAPEGCVVPVEKEIACLITIDDLKKLDTASLTDTVIIPGRAFVHDREASEVLGRNVVRGPEMLTADGETSMGMQELDVLTMEFEGFSALIQMINQYSR
ncbi:MAG TPA: methyl coenzyme M reductase-arginine methyltransferase Mmp10 [Methanocorpusculum sp.]|nr:methyl coenzyme M reductase-arginine methyltransferase Mmp10 [Methanocorpusculum sp.]HJJ39811.1 methyl coenzyme M reductase-arginine methyltransferase Mmp10 [Methanocorpusculum sp.]HJJ49421.1 methyl coenzyme M reductase-arginine methyltransferase Mmp10 [Methanocorpusculum sp.]HJJ57505.1 methyl coenzyme M reductase-arginine methyltransferase Mmp10 [Methanocorpusculum sp.]